MESKRILFLHRFCQGTQRTASLFGELIQLFTLYLYVFAEVSNTFRFTISLFRCASSAEARTALALDSKPMAQVYVQTSKSMVSASTGFPCCMIVVVKRLPCWK
jgi:hypothetical protein